MKLRQVMSENKIEKKLLLKIRTCAPSDMVQFAITITNEVLIQSVPF